MQIEIFHVNLLLNFFEKVANLGKWIGGGLGWAFAGYIGAVIGFLIVSLIDSGFSKTSVDKKEKSYHTTEGDFKMSLLLLVSCMMKADGSIKKSELAVVKQFLLVNFGRENALEALSILKELQYKEIDARRVAVQIKQHMNYPGRLELLHLLFEIGYADGYLHPAEYNFIKQISDLFSINSLDFNSVQAPYRKQTDINWAYKALEIESSASVDEIKAAYRKMAKKYHPDTLTGYGEDIKKTATEKFRTVNEAFESLKKQRGFN